VTTLVTLDAGAPGVKDPHVQVGRVAEAAIAAAAAGFPTKDLGAIRGNQCEQGARSGHCLVGHDRDALKKELHPAFKVARAAYGIETPKGMRK
jgi:hypothetical protein